MLKTQPDYTICQVHRDIYWLTKGIRDKKLRGKTQEKILLAFTMAKHMNKKLRRYKRDWDKGLWGDTKKIHMEKKND